MQPSETAPSSSSEVGRLTGVCFSPGAAFPDIAANGRWFLPVLILIILSSLSVQLMISHVGVEQMLQNAMNSNERVQQLSAEQKAAAMEQQRKFMPIMMRVMPVAGVFVGVLVIAGCLLFTFRLLLDAELSYKQVLNITSYASLPPSLVGAIPFIAFLFLKAPEDFDPQNASGLSAASFIPQTSAAWLKSLAGSLDIFTLWNIALVAIGFSAFLGERRMPFGRALVGVAVPWLVWVVLKMGFASIFG
ncbi:MAG: YIP1 family protein [Acidobacteria bacterium]|nr:YIP1 family protein [Acidobacteriota bacterium]